jgi:hypothetical protein
LSCAGARRGSSAPPPAREYGGGRVLISSQGEHDRLPASLMSAPNSNTSVGIRNSPPATPSNEAITTKRLSPRHIKAASFISSTVLAPRARQRSRPRRNTNAGEYCDHLVQRLRPSAVKIKAEADRALDLRRDLRRGSLVRDTYVFCDQLCVLAWDTNGRRPPLNMISTA